MTLEEKLPENIFLINDDMWWTKEDVGAYDYLVNTNKDFIKQILPLLDKKEVCVQAGGHCGWMIRELNKCFDYIYTFEPNPSEFTALCMNAPQSNIFKFNACVGNERKLVSMHCDSGAAGAGYIDGDGKIPMFMIDDLNLNSCDFIQLDLEGYEYFALQGAKQTIEKYKPVLCIERYWNARFNVTDEMIENFLKLFNYEFVLRIESDHFYKVK